MTKKVAIASVAHQLLYGGIIMEKTIKTVEEINQNLGVSSVSEVTQAHALKFIQLLPLIDKEVALQFLKLCPDLIQITPEVIKAFEQLGENAMRFNADSNTAAVNAYTSVIEACKKAMEDGNLSFTEKEKLISIMVEMADRVSDKDTENKKWHKEIHELCAKYGLGAIGVVAAILFAIIFGRKPKD